MYATKRRRRSLKGNNRLSSSKNGHEGCNGGGSSTGSLKSNPSKRHRERLNSELERLATLLPFEANILSKLDKLSILRLSVSFLRIKSYFQAIQMREHAYSAYDNPSGHQHVSKLTEHFPLDPSLTRTDSVLRALNGFVLVLTTQGEVFFASSTIEEFLGFHQSDVIHQSVFELIHSEDRAELTKQLSWVNSQPRTNQHDAFLPVENYQNLERSLTARFRCLLDNTSGFLRLEIRGRIGVLHGQNCHSTEAPLGLLTICCPFGPPTMLDNTPKDSMFKSKHKLDLSMVSLDPKGKEALGYGEDSVPGRSFYNWLHPDDTQYAASAHRELLKTSSCGLLAHRVLTKSAQWQWLQSSMRTVFKNGKPDHVTATHRPLSEEEGRDLLTKRNSVTKLTDLDDTEKPCPEQVTCTTRPPKPKKHSSPPNRENGNNGTVTSTTSSSRRRKSFSVDAQRGESVFVPNYPGIPTDTSSLNYCQNPYSAAAILDSARLFSSDSLLTYPQYSAGFYSAMPDVLPQTPSLQNGALLENSRSYDFYAAAAYPDLLPSTGDYLKSYYKGMDVFPTNDSSRLSGGVYGACNNYGDSSVAGTYQLNAKPSSSWMSHHRQSVVVWNNNSRPDHFRSGSSAWNDNSRNSHSLLPSSGFCSTDARQSGQHRTHDDPKETNHVTNSTSQLMDKPVISVLQTANFSISEATNTLLDSAG